MKASIGSLRRLIREVIEDIEEDTIEEDDGGGDSGGTTSSGGDYYGWGMYGMGGGMGGGHGFHDSGWSIDAMDNRDILDILFP